MESLRADPPGSIPPSISNCPQRRFTRLGEEDGVGVVSVCPSPSAIARGGNGCCIALLITAVFFGKAISAAEIIIDPSFLVLLASLLNRVKSTSRSSTSSALNPLP